MSSEPPIPFTSNFSFSFNVFITPCSRVRRSYTPKQESKAEEERLVRRRQSDPRAARLGITRRRKRKRDGGLKELAYAEWHQQATRETGPRPDIALAR